MSPAGARAPRLGLALVVGLCLLPRVLRWTGDSIGLVDGFYAHAALAYARGLTPYLDVTQVAFPFAEGLLALLVRLFGADVRVLEAATALVVLGTAAALWRAGRNLAGPLAGGVAAVAWSWSAHVAFFNLFERETWVALCTSLALATWCGALRTDSAAAGGGLGVRRGLAIAAALLAAFAIKITAVVPAAGLALHALLSGRKRALPRVVLPWLLGAAVLVLACWWRWGSAFLAQVFLFGLFRATTHAPHEALAEVLGFTDPLALTGWAGLLLVGLPRLRRPEGAPACMLLASLSFFAFVSPTVWDHNMIDLAPAQALLAGLLVASLLSARSWRAVARAAGVVVLLALAVLFVRRDELGAEARLHAGVVRVQVRASGHGTWGTSRAWLDRRADFVRRHTAPDEVIGCLDPWIAFAAGRVKFVRDWDLAGLARGLQASLEADGLVATLARRRAPPVLGPGEIPVPVSHPPRAAGELARRGPMADYLARLLANDLVWIRPDYLEALHAHAIALVLEPLPPGVIDDEDLLAAGYERFTDGGLAAWRPARR